MKRLVVTLLLCSAFLPIVASDHAWQHGKLIQISKSDGEQYGQMQKSGPVVSTLHIDVGDRIYIAQCSAWFEWSAIPKVTEMSNVIYRVVGDHLFLKDERGKQFKLQIVSFDAKTDDASKK